MPTAAQIKKIHILKIVLGLEDDLYRELLMHFNVQSSKELSYLGATAFIEILENKAVALNCWVKRPKKYENLNRINMASPAQMRMIEGLWREVSYFDDDKFAKKSLRKFLKSKFKTDDVMFLTKARASKVIQAIREIKKNLKSQRANRCQSVR